VSDPPLIDTIARVDAGRETGCDRRHKEGIRLLTRNGHNWANRFPLILEAVNHLKVRSCLIDGGQEEHRALLYALDLLELDSLDMRREPIETRKATLASLLRKGMPGVRLNEHLAHPNGAAVFHQACKLGAEGIVSKRLGSRYRSGRSPDRLKCKNPQARAVRA
jgi:bifunctional non-homologous end joining protein LigD